ncbi:MAG TPA: hypothetical protein PK289_01065 [Bacteroidia bacterium]|jgi:hypothetical protein|nr:hypothetical protein [Bacteroidia bacterium]HRG51488.1 hypothetical protein [Bacteroidia bacterium]
MNTATFKIIIALICTYFVGFGQTGHTPVKLSSKQINQLNKFNRLFGDYFYANERMQIIPVKGSSLSFDTFYNEVKNRNWNSDFEHNLDADSSILRQQFKNVITMNLNFNDNGILEPLPLEQRKQIKVTSLTEKKKALFVADTVHSIYQKYAMQAADEQKKLPVPKRNDTTSIRQQNRIAIQKAYSLDSIIKVETNKVLQQIKYTKETDPNGYELYQFSLAVIDSIRKYNIKRIYFFAHGYNVPRALAQLQGNRLLEKISEHERGNILFVRIFWQGGDAKKLSVKSKLVDGQPVLKKIIYRDEISFRNAKNFGKKKNEAIACGASLRLLLDIFEQDSITKNCTYLLMSHSLGAALICHSVINNISQIRYRPDDIVKITQETKYVLNDEWMRRADSLMSLGRCSWLKNLLFNTDKKKKEAWDYISFMRCTPLPQLKIKVFMNAPAVPGVQLFQFSDLTKNYNFIVGYNRYDPTLAKRFAGKSTLISGKLAYAGKNTSLGLNYNNEVGKTDFLITTSVLKKPDFIFKGYQTSTFFEHDLFFYMQHPLFTNALTDYIKR